MKMLTPKENLLRAYHHQKTEYVPFSLTDSAMFGFGAGNGPAIEKGPQGGGLDGFGVKWIAPASGGGAPIPVPNAFILEDVTEWKNKVTIPDVNTVDWEKEAERDFATYNREQQALDYGCGNGIFERLAALMGFENALMAMAEEPEAVNDLFTAITDYKIAFAEKVAKYYKADTFTNYDDIATERNLFMSPKAYRELIKPHHKRLYNAVSNMGMIPIQHTCGRAEGIVEDLIEIGTEGWTSVQPSNDIVTVLKKYGNKIAIIGGFDTNGKPSQSDASDEIIQFETERCIKDYGPYKGYIFFGFRLVNSLDPHAMYNGLKPIIETVMRLRMSGK
jgi:hypothetical protein